MITKTTIAAALISLGTLAAAPTQASELSVAIGFDNPGHRWSADNGYWHGDRRHDRGFRLSTDEERWMLRDRGYHQIRFFDDRGPVYQLRARKRGDVFFLVVSARTGEILSRSRI